MWNVLVVDDDAVNQKLLVEILAKYAKCAVASCGREAYDAFVKSYHERTPFDIILLDVAMPDMDGIEVLEKIREFEKAHNIKLGKGIPIIMVTAHTTSFMKSFNGGCDDFILKPVDGAKLIKKIESKIPAVPA